MSGNLTATTMAGELGHILDEDGKVSCSFLVVRPKDRSIDHASVNPGTGHAAWRMKLREACELYATHLEYRMWAMPGLVANSGDWLIYEIGVAGKPTFLKRMPNREAAEMWMLHGG